MTESRDDVKAEKTPEETAEETASPQGENAPPTEGAPPTENAPPTEGAPPPEGAQAAEDRESAASGRVVEGAEVSPSEGETGTEMNKEDLDALLGQMEVGTGPDKNASDSDTPSSGGGEFKLPEVELEGPEGEISPEKQIELLKDVNVKVRVELGRGSMYLRDILRLAEGSVVELEKLAGDPLDIYVNDRLIAKGEVLVLNENFCIRVTEIYSPQEVLRQTS